jgi:hypothetical protein
MGEIVCFWIEPTDRVRLWLRRYTHTNNQPGCCPLINGNYSYHTHMAPFGEFPARFRNAENKWERYLESYEDVGPPHDDLRWPTQCPCGHTFTEENAWQVFQQLIYRRPDTGQEMLTEEAPPGAMWDAWWMGKGRYPDGIQLMVMLPGKSEWWVDGPAKGGGLWTRTGTVPNISATPSIWSNQGAGPPSEYHGFLTGGKLLG